MVCSLCNYAYTIQYKGYGICIHCSAHLYTLQDCSPDNTHVFFNIEYWKNEGIIFNFFKYEFVEFRTFNISKIQNVTHAIKLNNNTYKFLIHYWNNNNTLVYFVITLEGFLQNTLNKWSCKQIKFEEINKEMIYPVASLQELAYNTIKDKNQINPTVLENVLRIINYDEENVFK